MTRPINPLPARSQPAQWLSLTALRPDVLQSVCSFRQFRALSRRWARLGRSTCVPSWAYPPAGVVEFLDLFAPPAIDPLERARDARSAIGASIPF